MLVLSRKVDERIIIDGGITITVLAIMSGGRVKIGISAPSQVPIHRQEILPQSTEDAAEEECEFVA